MEKRIDYQVLAPNSVAWFIQSALVADRTGNHHTRDLALAEAQRIAQERRLVQQTPEPCYDCRTNQQRIADLERRVEGLTTALGACAVSATVHGQGERLAALETVVAHRLSELELRMGQRILASIRHSERLENLEKLNLATRVAYLERRAQDITGPDAGL